MDSGWAVLAGVVATFLGTSIVPLALESMRSRRATEAARQAERVEVVNDWILTLEAAQRADHSRQERRDLDRQAVRMMMLLSPADARMRQYISEALSYNKPREFAFAFGQWARGGGFDESVITGSRSA